MEQLQVDWIESAQAARRQGTRGLLADTPRSRRSDPETSEEAAVQIRRSGELGRQQLAVLAAVHRWPGLTSLELAARLNLDRYQVARRLPEIEGALRVRRGDIKSINGRNHLTWWPR